MIGPEVTAAGLNAAEVLVHRSSVVNLQHVAEVQREGSPYNIGLRNGDRVRVSRGYGEVVRGWVV